jgi:hypothetical protein
MPAPEFDQRPGELEATRSITRQLPTIALAPKPVMGNDAGAVGGRHLFALMTVEACDVILTTDQMRALARNLLWTADMLEDTAA